jgi:hypothetical protein
MSSLTRLFGTSLENAAATQPEQLFKSHRQTAPVIVNKTGNDENRTANSEEQYTDESAVLSWCHRRCSHLQKSEEESNTDFKPWTRNGMARNAFKPPTTVQCFKPLSIPPRRWNLALQLAIRHADSSALFGEVEPVPICIFARQRENSHHWCRQLAQ